MICQEMVMLQPELRKPRCEEGTVLNGPKGSTSPFPISDFWTPSPFPCAC